jgi:hypothetical protein
MAQILLIGIGSGAASALLFASFTSGSPLAIILFYLAPLPILIAAIGWRHPAGLVGLLAGSLGIAAAQSPMLALLFATGVALPAWWLAYLALLARPSADGTAEWYPVGRVVLWTAALAAVLVTASVPMLAGDLATYQAAMRSVFEQVLRTQLRTPADAPLHLPNGGDAAAFIDLMVLLVPPTGALLWTVTTLGNLWLAGRIVQRSGRLQRPWPDVALELAFPRGTAALLGAAVLLGSVASGLLGLAAKVLATALLAVFAMLGLAVLHVVTRGMAARPIVLVATYLFTLLQGWPFLLFALLGLAEQLFGIRARFLARRSPSPPLDPTR